jgi:hypothetical protein
MITTSDVAVIMRKCSGTAVQTDLNKIKKPEYMHYELIA